MYKLVFKKSIIVCLILSCVDASAWNKRKVSSDLIQYQRNLKSDVNEWRKANLKQIRSLQAAKAEQIESIAQDRDEDLNEVEKEYQENLGKLQKMMMKKTTDFQLKSDVAFVRSVKYRKQKFLKSKPILQEYYDSLINIEKEFNEQMVSVKMNLFKNRVDLLNKHRPNFFPATAYLFDGSAEKLAEKDLWLKDKFCKVQKYYQTQQVMIDFNSALYTSLYPYKIEVFELEKRKELLKQEFEMYQSSLETLRIMREEMSRHPKELSRIKKELKRVSALYTKTSMDYNSKSLELLNIEKELNSKRNIKKNQIACVADQNISSIEIADAF
jgi:DNA-binding protein H-NS